MYLSLTRGLETGSLLAMYLLPRKVSSTENNQDRISAFLQSEHWKSMFLATHAGYDLIKLADQRYKTPAECNGVNLSKPARPARLGWGPPVKIVGMDASNEGA